MNLKALLRAQNDTRLIVTPRVNDYLLHHGDDPVSPRVAEIIADLISTKPRVRERTFSGSSAGECKRKQVLSFLGFGEMVVDVQLRNVFNDGKWRHLRWQAMLLDLGVINEAEFSLTAKRYFGVGTMDGLGIVPDDHPQATWRGEEFGFELKGVSGFQYPTFKDRASMPKPAHLAQVDRYFYLSGMKLFVVLYEDKSTQHFTEWVIERDEERVACQERELIALSESVRKEKLPKMLPQCVRGEGEWLTCQYGGKDGSCLLAKTWPTKRTPGYESSVLAKDSLT